MTDELKIPSGLDDKGLDLFKIAVDEYRFEVTLNWQRSQYLLALNAAIVSVGTGLLSAGSPTPGRAFLTTCVFAVGVFTALFALIATDTQRGYYQAARDHMKSVAKALEIEGWSTRTTPGQGGSAPRLMKVTTAVSVLFVIIAVVDLVGAAFASRHSLPTLAASAGALVVVAGTALALKKRIGVVLMVAGALVGLGLGAAGAVGVVRRINAPAAVEIHISRCAAAPGGVHFEATVRGTRSAPGRRADVRVVRRGEWLGATVLNLPSLSKREYVVIKAMIDADVSLGDLVVCRVVS